MGDSIIKGICFFYAITLPFPGATLADITDKMPSLLRTLPPQSTASSSMSRTPADCPPAQGALHPTPNAEPLGSDLLLRSQNPLHQQLSPLSLHSTTTSQPQRPSRLPTELSPSSPFHHETHYSPLAGSIPTIICCRRPHQPTSRVCNPTTFSLPPAPSFEHIALKLPGPSPLIITVLYRPPKPNPSFLQDFSDFLLQLSTISPSILRLSDLNLHLDDPTSRPAQDFLDILNHCNFTQHINFPTHKHGHILDPVCSTNITISDISSYNLHISDHLAITLDIHIHQPSPTTPRTITFRKLTPLSPEQFALQLVNSIPTSPSPPSANTGDLIKLYNSTLLSCLDNIAPIHQRTVSYRRPAPLYTPKLREMKRTKRQLERLHKKTGLTVHLHALTEYIHKYNNTLNTAQTSHYSNIIHAGSSNPRSLFSTVNCLLEPQDHISSSFTTSKCNTFLKYSKIKSTPSTTPLAPCSISSTTLATVTSCLNKIKTWMHHNFLKLNRDKSDLIIIGPKTLTKTTSDISIHVDQSCHITPSSLVRNLGIHLDPNLTFDHHISQLARSAFLHLQNIA
ncbi:hypothetical protein D5F01_LYC22364 [Xyrichtys novacula]|uniref:Endonuclease/exonuclease/phosphatase domain-containing protein n=1 Tax=Xyrichtys novacula TaxID=13765 RepID=A0AAV1HLJ4_XYRNO|nr:hypothetical protein D5F01_LYC22364 [Xyrichtys novacula]